MANPKITEELVQSWFGDVNARGWVMTIQGHPVFVIGKGPPGVDLLYEEAFDKHDNSSTAKHLSQLEWSKKLCCVGKSSQLDRMTYKFISMYSPTDNWQYRRYQDSYKVREKIEKSKAFKDMWKRCMCQIKSIKIKTDTKKGVAVKYIREMFDPIYSQTKTRFKLSDDECMQAFEDAIELLKVKMVMNA